MSNTEMIKAMPVQRVPTQGGTRVLPPFDSKWSKRKQVAWAAGLCEVDTGVDVVVETFRAGIWGRRYNVTVGTLGVHTTVYGYPYESAILYLRGVVTGSEVTAVMALNKTVAKNLDW